jgi:2-iminoacetate synthase
LDPLASQFSAHFEKVSPRLEELSQWKDAARPLEAILETARGARGLNTEDIASLMVHGQDAARREAIHAAARELREQTGGRTIEIIIPEYLTSICQNDCLYCGYRKSNVLAERVQLSLNDYERELDLILAWGYRQIELVLSDDPDFGADRLAPYVELTRRKLAEAGGGVVALNAPAYNEESYRLLFRAGIDWVALWQETYDEAHFGRWHFQGSPKREFAFRLNVWDRALAAGFTRVGLGILFGLYDWRFDVLALAEHAQYLQRTYGVEPHAFGIPRLKAARGVLASQKPSRFSVSDEDFQLAISLYRLAFPRTRLFFNTRETYEFNMAMVARGDLFTVDCETLPGAYLRGRLPGQFTTYHYPPRGGVRADFARRGFVCRYLEPEDPRKLAAIEAQRPRRELAQSLKDVAAEHDQVRIRASEWQDLLERLRATPPYMRRVAAGELRERLRYFETDYIAHCREEERLLSELKGLTALDPAQTDAMLQYHERFAVDLDRFQRQIASYEQSGNPTVLLALGGRIIAELREHLESEANLLAICSPSTGADLGQAGA